ncbi:type II secretion system F family protein [Pseudarthrobacter sp. NPDC058196]|uniref:type II secretion system F family protein n=1 Tax=Pseudarthrobacter sp. NPDC058196 TaxID=3346376 RepID=UPI0036DD4C94
MTLFLAVLLCTAVLLLRPPLHAAARLRSVARNSPAAQPSPRRRMLPWFRRAGSASVDKRGLGLTLVVQQLAALLRGGRTPARLWDELWTVYGVPGRHSQRLQGAVRPAGPVLSPGSTTILAAARAAAATGAPVSEAIRRVLPTAFPGRDREAGTWTELAACLDIAEASGCPLADVLTRFAAQLEAAEDADAARQTALAGPKATVRLLTWLPLMGLGLGAALGVDPLATLLGTPLGLAALVGGVVLTMAGRVWSARLVSAAAESGP